MHSDLKILDPIWTPAYIVRDHGYMIYDTLFAQDAHDQVVPEMAESYEVSADQLTYIIRLRDGLRWHDGLPVTSDDCIASIRRWAARDVLGQKIIARVRDIRAADERTMVISLAEPTSLLIPALAKPSAVPPFMMPKRVAQTDPGKQISDFTGSGPFVFKKDEWKPGEKVVYVKFGEYKPRSEPPSGLGGGKIVKVDRVEWLALNDAQQAINALARGEIDYLEQPPHDLLKFIQDNETLKLVDMPSDAQFSLRFNSTQPPLNNPMIRQAAWYALNQTDFLQAAIGNPAYYKACKSFYPCGSPMATSAGMGGLLESNFQKSRNLLAQAGYDGQPIVLMASTDLAVLTNLSPVAKQLLEKGGFKVDMQSMDWNTSVSRRSKKEGWGLYPVALLTSETQNPLVSPFLNASCEKAAPGWPCDARLERIREDFLNARTPTEQKDLAAQAQQRAIEITTHIPLGEFRRPVAVRRNIEGILPTSFPVFWNIAKN